MQHDENGWSRRTFLWRSAMASLGTLAAGAVSADTVRAEGEDQDDAPSPPHGTELRGMSWPAQNRTREARFGYMLKTLPAYGPSDQLLIALGQKMEEEPKSPPATFDENDAANDNPNLLLTSGITFLGQFVDHDITFDNTPLSQQLADPNALTNFRTPRYDLDTLYGRGPLLDKKLYDPSDRAKLLLVVNANGVEDVPRDAAGKAIIGDERNDQHLIIVQLHIAMAKFHNKLVDHVRSQRVAPAAVFATARTLTRWYYQWVIIHDFLPRIVGQSIADQVYRDQAGKAPLITLKYYKPTNVLKKAFIPLEFAAAAYRFGHSMTRPRYTMSGTVSKVPLFEATPTDNNLNGSRPIPERLKIQWSKFFGPGARPTRKIDTRLSSPLFSLPASVVPDANPLTLLAVRNLLRAKRVGVQSGQRVAQALGTPALSNEELGLPAMGLQDPGWSDQAPLWFYILKEAELLAKGEQLGPTGGRIIAEVLVGLLQRDLGSYLYLDPRWKPKPPIAPALGQFGMIDLLTYAGAWS